MKFSALSAIVLISSVLLPHSDRPLPPLHKTPNSPRSPKTDFKSKGTVKDVRPGLFYLAADDGEQWLVQIAAPPKDIVYSGSAEI